MRILVAIPHFHRATDLGYYGSLSQDWQRRLGTLRACLTSLRQSLGPRQRLLAPGGTTLAANDGEATEIDVVVCTTRGDHLVEHLPPGLCLHHNTAAKPPLLGYECHAVLRDQIGRYDWYAYMEDDLCLTDPLFFRKLAWFSGLAPDELAVLQPNRFEVSPEPPFFRLYVDGPPNRPEKAPSIRDSHPASITAPHLDGAVTFKQTANPHSGTFFLTEAQMRHWAAQPDFLDRSTDHIGPLESAATLGLIRHFATYKPARENAAFLEILHGDPRYLDNRLRFEDQPPYRYALAERG